jgi:predicted dehydrogenase
MNDIAPLTPTTLPPSPLSVGIIGTGSIAGGGHGPALVGSSNIVLTAVLSRDLDRSRAFIAEHAFIGACAFDNLKSFLKAPKLDLVIVCSPDGLHFQQASACLKAGKHLLIEKPMATSVEECELLIQLAKESNVALAVGFHLRHHVGLNLLREQILKHQEIGAIRHIRALWAWPQLDPSNWRAHENLTKWWSLSAVGAHCLDLVRWMADDLNDFGTLKAIKSTQLWNGPHDESTMAIGTLSSGVTFEVTSSIQFGPYNRLEIFGSQGTAVCTETFGRKGAGEIYIKGKPLNFTPTNPFKAQLEHLATCIREGISPSADGRIGHRNVTDLLSIMQRA